MKRPGSKMIARFSTLQIRESDLLLILIIAMHNYAFPYIIHPLQHLDIEGFGASFGCFLSSDSPLSILKESRLVFMVGFGLGTASCFFGRLVKMEEVGKR